MSSTSTPTIPPLVDGDRLSREEFHRRYLAMPHLKKAELIDGVVYMPSPVSSDVHATPQCRFMTWLGLYEYHTPNLRPGDNGTLILEGDNEPQPDLYLMIEHSYGGRAMLDPDGYIAGGPELVVEIAASSVSRDRNARKRMYRANGVLEYIIWRTEQEAIDWFILRDGKYEPLPLDEGIYKSEVFPGLWLDPQAMIRTDKLAVLQTLQRGMATPEHAAFVARLTSSPQP